MKVLLLPPPDSQTYVFCLLGEQHYVKEITALYKGHLFRMYTALRRMICHLHKVLSLGQFFYQTNASGHCSM